MAGWPSPVRWPARLQGVRWGCGPGGQFSLPATRVLRTAFHAGDVGWVARQPAWGVPGDLAARGCIGPGEEAMDQICLVVLITAELSLSLTAS